jgi:hypothetical protein
VTGRGSVERATPGSPALLEETASARFSGGVRRGSLLRSIGCRGAGEHPATPQQPDTSRGMRPLRRICSINTLTSLNELSTALARLFVDLVRKLHVTRMLLKLLAYHRLIAVLEALGHGKTFEEA